MKFTCNQQMLAKALSTVSRAVSNKTTMPVLKGILMETTQDGKLILTASDLEMSIRKEIDVNVEEVGSTVVISKLFSDIIRKLPDDIITIYKEERDVIIKTNFSEFKLVSLQEEEFPSIGEKEEGSREIVLQRSIFKDMVKKTAFAASIDESKGALVGILTEMEENTIKMVSLDGFRLALVSEEMNGDVNESFILSAKLMNEISKIIMEDDDESDISIYLGKKKAVFSVGNTFVILRRMEGEFIKYKDIIPKEQTTKVIAGRDFLLEGIERASLLAKEGKNNLIKISIVNDLMKITSRSEEGNVKEEIIVEKEGNDIEIGFNSKYVMDVLKVIDDERISLNFKTGISPCVIRPIEGNKYEYLVLPVRIPTM